MTGTVTDAVSLRPIANAEVRLYFYRAHAGLTGCFSLGGADALPFEMNVSAPGYKPLLLKPSAGSFQVNVTLIPEGGVGTSSAETRKISYERYLASWRVCH